ncbi:MAG TPA: protein translocase subunit SecD [Chthonomonadales bacterium]|nr:protein translocase subunit SecD [Chthonomonadales bacterium]
MKNPQVKVLLIVLLLLIGAIIAAVRIPTMLGLDIQGGMRVVLRAKTEELQGKEWTPDSLASVENIIRRRIDALGVAEPVIYRRPEQNQIVVELPGLRDKDAARRQIQTTAQLEFRKVPELENEWRTEEEEIDGRPTGFERILGQDGNPVSAEEMEARVFSKLPVLTGADLEPNSRAELTPQGVHITFEFRGDARRVFEEFTRANLNRRLAIFLDKRLISAPVIEGVIPGSGIIHGQFTPEQARQTAELLNAGALPVPLAWESENTVEATLGRMEMRRALIAGAVGLAAVLVFMVSAYAMPGVLACIALLMYAVFTFAAFKLITLLAAGTPLTLTIPGLTGFILSVGMAVDANVLIFERMKEERLAGKSIKAAIESGFKRAFNAIFDTNACTVIACVILYHYGTGPVQGFALTLAIGVLVSMFTAITVSRTLLLLFAGTAMGQNDAAYALHRGFKPRLGVSRRMKLWFALSGLVLVPGLVAWLGMNGMRYSIEFTGGTEIGAAFTERPTRAALARSMTDAGFGEPRVILSEGNRAFITTRRLDHTEQARAISIIQGMGGRIETTDSVSGSFSDQIRTGAKIAVVLSSVLIVLYLAVRFAIGGFREGMKFGLCNIGAVLHDVLALWGIFAILGIVLEWQIDSLFVTAMLTTIGFSTHDTIVIFDRIRENLKHRARGEEFADVADRSIDQTFARSVNTSITTMLVLVALLIFGGPVIREFVAALLIGIILGTYSSIFNAAPLLVLWRHLTGDRMTFAPAMAGGPALAPALSPVPRPVPRAATAGEPLGSRPQAAPRPKPPTLAAPAGQQAPSTAGEQAADGDGAGAARGRTKRRKRRM